MDPKVLNDRRILLAITGASGVLFAERFLVAAAAHFARIYVVFTKAGAQVVRHELKQRDQEFSLRAAADGQVAAHLRDKVRVLPIDDFFAPVASGTSAPTDMLILPCSMGTLARVAHGMSTNLLDRAADVMLKEKKRLVICPREAPLSSIHLRNMLTLSDLGAVILPLMPAFYFKPESVDDLINFMVGKILDSLEISHTLTPRWNARCI